MKKLSFILLHTLLAAFVANAQLSEKAEDISPLLIGETLPSTVLKATDGSDHELLNVIKQKPAVILFYRGGWCPFCNTHLAEIQNVQGKIVFEYINPDYSTRLSAKLLLAVLKNLEY